MTDESLRDLLRPPDFEVRCDGFIAHIRSQVAPEYPNLTIKGENYTKEELQRLPAAMTIAQRLAKGRNYLRGLEKRNREIEELSATENRAVVEIKGRNPEALSEMTRAIDDMSLAAQRFRGDSLLDPDAVMEDIEDPDHPRMVLFLFSNDPSPLCLLARTWRTEGILI